MDWKEINEASEAAGYGEKIPKQLKDIINRFMRRKSLFSPKEFTMDDFATCSVIYDFFGVFDRKKKYRQAKEDKDGGWIL